MVEGVTPASSASARPPKLGRRKDGAMDAQMYSNMWLSEQRASREMMQSFLSNMFPKDEPDSSGNSSTPSGRVMRQLLTDSVSQQPAKVNVTPEVRHIIELHALEDVRKAKHLVREALSDLARAKSDGADEATLEIFEREIVLARQQSRKLMRKCPQDPLED